MLAAVGLIAYLILMVGIGIYYKKKSEGSVGAFLIGERKLPWWWGAISERASAMSGWWTLGFPGMGASGGPTNMFWGWSCSVGAFLNWHTLSRRLRKLSGYYNANTIPDLFSSRFRDKSNVVRIVSSAIIIVFMTTYMTSQLVGMGKTFGIVFGWEYSTGIIVGMVITMLYTMLGGYLAVVATDVIQGFLMMFTMFLVPVIALIAMGGPGVMAANASAVNPNIFKFGGSATGFAVAAGIINAISNGIPLLGQPHVINRLMSVKDVDNMKNNRRSAILGFTSDFFVTIFAITAGILALALTGGMKDNELSIFYLCQAYIPDILAGILYAGILAAIMSTANSMLLSAAGEISETIYHRVINPKASDKTVVLLTRISIVVLTLIVCYGALKGGSVFTLTLYAWNGLGACFVPAVIALIYWKRYTKWGCVVGMLTGMGAVIAYTKLGLSAYLGGINACIPCTLLSALVMVIVSLCTTPPKEAEEDFEIYDMLCEDTDGKAKGV